MKKSIKAIFFRDFSTSYIPNILQEMYIERVYAPYLENKENLTILDIGANIGLFSFYAYPYASKIYALEPSYEHVEVMNRMLDQNNMKDKVYAIKKALSHVNGTAKFYHNDNTTMFSLNPAVNSKPDEVEEVQTITLDKLMEDYELDHIDFMKLDVEGAEHEIIGSEGFAKVAHKIDIIMGEHHSWSGRNPAQLETALRDYGFEFQWFQHTQAQIFIAKRI